MLRTLRGQYTRSTKSSLNTSDSLKFMDLMIQKMVSDVLQRVCAGAGTNTLSGVTEPLGKMASRRVRNMATNEQHHVDT